MITPARAPLLALCVRFTLAGFERARLFSGRAPRCGQPRVRARVLTYSLACMHSRCGPTVGRALVAVFAADALIVYSIAPHNPAPIYRSCASLCAERALLIRQPN